MARQPVAIILSVVFLLAAGARQASAFSIGLASNYAVLFTGAGSNTLQITNVTVNGNVGIANTGKATDSGPSSITGRIDFAAANIGQFQNNNASDVITGGVNYGVSNVATANSTLNALSQTLAGEAGASVAVNGTQTVNATSGNLISGDYVFNVTSFNNGGGQTLTINGGANDFVVFNLGGLGNVQVHGGISLVGGITSDHVLFNVGGGNYTTNTGAGALDINNNGGAAGIARGIFLDPNGAMDATNATVLGRVFGGDTHDMQIVSGTSITAPAPVPTPEPASLLLCGTGLAVLARRRLRARA